MTSYGQFWHRKYNGVSLANWNIRHWSAKSNQCFIGIDLRHYESRDFSQLEHIIEGNPMPEKILFKCIHNIASASHTNPCHI